MNTNDGRIVNLESRGYSTGDAALAEAFAEQQIEELNRDERRKNGTTPWVRVSPAVAHIVSRGNKVVKRAKRKAAAASRRRNR